jgi:hypothetical protein
MTGNQKEKFLFAMCSLYRHPVYTIKKDNFLSFLLIIPMFVDFNVGHPWWHSTFK